MGWTPKGPLGGDRELPLAGTVAVINVNSSSVYLGVLSVIFLGIHARQKRKMAMRLTWAD